MVISAIVMTTMVLAGWGRSAVIVVVVTGDIGDCNDNNDRGRDGGGQSGEGGVNAGDCR